MDGSNLEGLIDVLSKIYYYFGRDNEYDTGQIFYYQNHYQFHDKIIN